MELSGKVAVVTGASMGIGEAISQAFADHGAAVVLLSRDAARAEAARSRIGHPETTLALSCDVRHREEIDRVVGLTMHHFNRIDIWVNNAGRGIVDSIAEVDPAASRDTFDTNYFGAVACMQAVIPVMRQQGAGAIINISSVAGHIPLPFHAVYSATKFAMNAIGKAARMELARYSINVLTVCPGFIATDFSKNMLKGSNPQRVGGAVKYAVSVDVVAQATLRGLLKRKREVVVPGIYSMFIKMYQALPGVVENRIRKALKPTSQVLAEAKSQK